MVRLKLFIFFIVLGCGAILSAEAHPSIQDIKEKLGFKEGLYELVKGTEEECQASRLPLAYEQVGDSTTLHLGDSFIFAYLESAKFTEKGEKGCTFTTQNIVDPHRVKQAVNHSCKNKKGDFQRWQSLAEANGELVYSYKRENVDIVCRWRKTK